MKRRTLLVLAVVVTATAPLANAVDNKPMAAAPLTQNEVLLPVSYDPERPWRLRWAVTEAIADGNEVFITVHERSRQSRQSDDQQHDIDRQSRAAIYSVVNGQWLLLFERQTAFGTSHYLRPSVVWTRVAGPDYQREQLVHFTELYFGTGSFREEHVYRIQRVFQNEAAAIIVLPVTFIPADQSFAPHFAPGEYNAKGVVSVLGPDDLTFSFFIWRKGDGNCCPTAGRVHGTYLLQRGSDGQLKISMDTFRRLPAANR